ncbi:MAG: bifunctional rhamnulose-1-phosphate aldolase/short-chain dehydrogenase [Fimbriimonas sp.]
MPNQEASHLIPSLWDPAKAPTDPVDLLIYASNLLGSDPRITNFGGGNTSSKIFDVDPLTGEEVEVLWVKGSGGDLGMAKRNGFASLYQAKVLGLEARFHDHKMHEDEIVPLYPQCSFNLNPAAPSIDTPLHADVPAPCVSHMHSDAVIAVAAALDARTLMDEVYKGQMGYLPWKRPGFELGLMLRDLIREKPGINSALMASHGFICWADTWEECYELTIRLINEAAEFIAERGKGKPHAFGEVVGKRHHNPREVFLRLLPKLRGKVTFQGQRLIANINSSEAVLDFLGRSKRDQLVALGTSCPDHFLRTKIRPLVLDADADDALIDEKLAEFRENYAAYYERCKHADSPAIRNPNPSVVLIPGVGMISFGKNPTEARVTGEFYRNAVAVMHGAETISTYTALPEQEAFNIEYWLLEEAKLKRQPPEKEMSRRIVLLIGAGPGIGYAIAERLLDQGATLVLTDRNKALVDESVTSLRAKFGKEVVYGETLDITDRSSVRKAIEETILKYGGLDSVINIAAIFIAPDATNFDEVWKKTYDINVFGSMVVADEAAKAIKSQGLLGSVVLVSSANAVVAKKGSVAYDTSKAAVNHVVRELAVEYAPYVRVNAVAPATVVSGSQMFPRDRVISSLQKYDIPFEEGWSDEELRDALASFYAQRTLLKQAVTPGKVADAAYLLASDRLGQTTGQVLAVDAGLAEAFLR